MSSQLIIRAKARTEKKNNNVRRDKWQGKRKQQIVKISTGRLLLDESLQIDVGFRLISQIAIHSHPINANHF